MKTVIAGSRDLNISVEMLDFIVEMSGFKISEVVCGGARCIDLVGKNWAESRDIPVKMFEVTQHDWNTLGKKAGPLRNQKMAEYAEALLAIWDGKSKGTGSMIKYAEQNNLVIFILRTDLTGKL
jgi:hypothetical protein